MVFTLAPVTHQEFISKELVNIHEHWIDAE